MEEEKERIRCISCGKVLFEAKKANSSTETSAEMGNYDSYGLTTGGFYMYVARVENTLIYLDVEEEFKEDAKAFVEEFGY